jgi:hypothetical protein
MAWFEGSQACLMYLPDKSSIEMVTIMKLLQHDADQGKPKRSVKNVMG